MIEFPGAYGGTVQFTFDAALKKAPDSVLVMIGSEDEILFTYHSQRGWELPGGKLEQGETPLAAAVREAYEETGVSLKSIRWIGQYEVYGGQPDYLCKWVYFATIESLGELPSGFETAGYKLFTPWPTPADICHNAAFSTLVKDDVYRILYSHFAKK